MCWTRPAIPSSPRTPKASGGVRARDDAAAAAILAVAAGDRNPAPPRQRWRYRADGGSEQGSVTDTRASSSATASVKPTQHQAPHVAATCFYQPTTTLRWSVNMQAIIDLHRDVLEMYAYHAETCGAIHFWNKSLKGLAEESKNPDQTLFVGKGDPNSKDAKYQYKKTVVKAIADSAENGTHERILRRSVIAMIYATWEDQYRQQIAYECNLDEKNEIKSDVFHDLNKYRRAILHAGGRLVDAPNVIQFFKRGEQVLLTKYHIDELFSILINEINRIAQIYYNQDPKLTLDVPLYQPPPTDS